MNKRKIRDYLKLSIAILMGVLYIPHLLVVVFGGGRLVFSDVDRMLKHENIPMNKWLGLLYLLHTNSYYRTIFYNRIGPVAALLIGWYRPGNKYFTISYTTKIGRGFFVAHPYSTIINANSIGANFSCIQCTTIGKKGDKRPVIGDNVSLGANVVIIGDVKIGNNVIIGAGSVVVKDIPDNSVAVGNPARVIKTIIP